MITCKLNPRVYNSLLVLLDAVRLYRAYRWLDTLPLYLYYELLTILISSIMISAVQYDDKYRHRDIFIAWYDIMNVTILSSYSIPYMEELI